MKAVLSLVQAFLFLVSAFAVEDSNFKEWVDRAAVGLTASTRVSFDTLPSSDLTVTAEEKAQCRAWYDEHVRLAAGDLSGAAYALNVAGRSMRRCAQDWDVAVGKESAEGAVCRGGKTTVTTLTHRRSGLVAAVEATIYEEYATCEWTVTVRNTNTERSPVVSQFYALDGTLPTGRAELLVSKGSGSDADDFELCGTAVNRLPMRFSANGGRTSSFLPYFNLTGKDLSVVLAVGWTGQWRTTLRQKRAGVAVNAAQETFRGYLDGGEAVRSPRMSCTFYRHANPVKGFNMLRSWEMDCVVPESAFCLTTQGAVSEFDRRGSDELVQMVKEIPQEICDAADFLWMDAGWYTNGDNWYDTVGTWIPDPVRFPQGLRPFSDAIHARGMGFLLWYEPERCCKDTQVWREASQHAGWLFPKKNDDNVNMFNLANDDACDYLGRLIAQSIRDNGVDVYRQDFNFDPLAMWEKADKTLYGSRKGFEENHYVTNLYRYLDTLTAENPGLLIDNCASGGRRLDLEMTRRGIPLWRSDYNCMSSDGQVKPDVIEATQAQTYALSCWLPIYGTGAYRDGEYADRTNILPCAQRIGYADVRQFMTQQYFPLIYDGLDLDGCVAMQFGTAEAGTALLYKRENVQEKAFTLRLSGLDPAAVYSVWDYDEPDAPQRLTGEALMREGFALVVPQSPKAVVVQYAKQP